MTKQELQLARDALRKLTSDTLLRGMRAFSHPPRLDYQRVGDDVCGCFNAAAFDADAPDYPGVAFHPMTRVVGRDAEWALSIAYETCTEWFHGECVRELAERGVASEPALAALRGPAPEAPSRE